MTCRACGAIIAAKAIVCYKCGTPTADMPEVSRVPATRSAFRVTPLLVAWIAAVAALSVWLLPKTTDGTWERWAAWGAVLMSVALGAWLFGRSRSSTLRRR